MSFLISFNLLQPSLRPLPTSPSCSSFCNLFTHYHPGSDTGLRVDSSAARNEEAAGRDACHTRYIACPVGQTLTSLQRTGSSPSLPGYSGSEDALKPVPGKRCFRLREGRKLPLPLGPGKKKAGGGKSQNFKRREAGGDTGSGDHGPLPLAERGESVRGVMWPCMSYPDMAKSSTSRPASLPL